MNWVDSRKRNVQEEDGKKDKRHQAGLGGEERSGWTRGVTMDRVNKRGHDGQGGQQGLRWTGWTRWVTMDRADKRDNVRQGGQEGSR